jgi:hypothetical protein
VVIGRSARQPSCVPGEEIGPGPHPPVILAERGEECRTEGDLTVAAALALLHAEHHAPAIDIADFQLTRFAATQASAVTGSMRLAHRARSTIAAVAALGITVGTLTSAKVGVTPASSVAAPAMRPLTRDIFQPAAFLNVIAAAWIQFMVHAGGKS